MTAPAAAASPPLIGSAAQLESLARVLLAQRSTLEAIVKMAGKDSAIADVAHSAVDQLDAAFVIVNALQLTAGMSDAGATIEGPAPSTDGRPEKPPVFGGKRKAAAAAAQQSTNHPGANDDGRKQGGTPPRGESDAAGAAQDGHGGREAERSDRGPERAGVGAAGGG